MYKIIVNGGCDLQGDIRVSGSKNAALPIIFACILTNGVSEIKNLPDVGDVRVALKLITSLGAKVKKNGDTTYINTTDLAYQDLDPDLVSKIRASTYLLGACLSRFGISKVMSFGGCSFSSRPIDMHIDACLSFGASFTDNILRTDFLVGTEISFRKASVGATVNAILLASTADGDSIIRGCAVEPHIDALIGFLTSCGAHIVRQGRDIFISGRSLHGGKITIIGDMIEAGSYITLGLICGNGVKILDSPIDDMLAITETFVNIGAEIYREGDCICVDRLRAGKRISVSATPYPGFPTDLQPIIAPLMAYAQGGVITDEVWPSRFGYLKSLENLGVKSNVCGNTAEIFKSNIVKGVAIAPDLRGGMACLLSALTAYGQSEIFHAEIILRGYEKLEEKLCAIGASINIIESN